MTARFLPEGHVIETVRTGSPFIGTRDYATRQLIAAGDTIVVCRRVAQPAVTSVEAWGEAIEACYNCGARNPGYGTPPPFPYAKTPQPSVVPVPASTSSPPTVVLRPDQLPGAGARRPQASSTPLLAVMGAVVALLILGFIFTALGDGRAADSPTNSRPSGELEQAAVVTSTAPARSTSTPLPTPVPTVVPTAAPPTPAPPPTQRARPTAPPPPTATPQAVSPIRRLVLVDAARDRELFTLVDGGTISLSRIGARYLTVLAETSGPIGSVLFRLDGQDFCLNQRCAENSPPYSMAGDLGGDHYNNWDWNNLLGTHTISAVPYTGPGATGEALPALTLQLTITR